MMNWLLQIKDVKAFVSAFLILAFVYTGCKFNQQPEAFLDKDGALTTKDITQNRDMQQYDEEGNFWCRNRADGNENDRLNGEKKVRNFIWQHWNEKKRGYIKLSCPGTDVLRTEHYFIEPDPNGNWNIVTRYIYRASNDKISRDENVFDSVKRIENENSKNWTLIIEAANRQSLERLPTSTDE